MPAGFAGACAARKDSDARFDLMCRLVWGRAPGNYERDKARVFLDRERERAALTQPARDETSLWSGLARVLFSSADFLVLP